jgi:eukaryotic-like serine/threonine-protein kinase
LPPNPPYGPFTLVQRISVGGMAEVFQAVHRGSNQVVALKRILPNVAEDEEFIELFHDEARIASQLSHDNIARIIDVGQVNGSHYIALEFVNGQPLRTLIDRAAAGGATLPIELALFMISEVCRGLAYAHQRTDEFRRPLHIVHRDVSPQNVLISYSGQVKLIDFGIAKAAGKITRTQAGMIKGKIGYMSPEQIAGVEVDQRADLFALGICLWESLTGKRLYDGINELVVMNKIRSESVPPPSSVNPRLPRAVDPIVLKALAKDPNQRYATASEFEADLRAFAHTFPALGDSARLAALMRQMFPAEAAQAASGREESNGMSEKGGSDLDVFDGLAKKSNRPGPASAAPAPRSLPAPTPPPQSSQKQTLLGLPPPPLPPPQSGRNLPPPPSMRSGPGAPPSRLTPPPQSKAGTLPPPPSRMPKPGAPGPLPPKPPPASAAPVDMDWDDEDEKTAIFDKEPKEEAPAQALLRASGGPSPAAGAPAPSGRLGGAAALMAGSGGAAAPSIPSPMSGPTPSGGPPSLPMPPSMPAPMPQSMSSPALPMAPVVPAAYPAAQPSGGTGRMILLAVAALLAIGLIAAMIVVFLPRKGTMVVTVAGPGNKSVDAVQVYVDSQKRCDTSPCRVAELSTGTHMVKVTAAGYQPTADQAVKVNSGEDAVLNVTLSRASEGTGIRVTADTVGSVKLSVDGKEIGPLPQELKDMTAGEHVIKIAGDRYEAWEKRINVEADQLQTIEPRLKVVKGLATIKGGTGADGARVLLVSGSERRPIPKLPIKIDITTDKPWSIVAGKSGYEDFKKDIVFQDGKAEETFVIDMWEKGKKPGPQAASTGGHTPVGGQKPGVTKPPPGGGIEKPAATGNGTLNINSIPVSNVILDGRPMGSTPKVGLSVTAGNHTVVFVHPEHGRKTRVVNVPTGGSATAAVRFP